MISKCLWLVEVKFVCPLLIVVWGVRDLIVFNKALLGKWMWRFGVEESKFWRRVLVAKYGVTRRGWCTRLVRGSHGCSFWKGIMANWDIFQSYIVFEVGKGNKLRFWHDKWCGDCSLKDEFPLLFKCSRDREAFIDSLYTRFSGVEIRDWHLHFVRNFNDWEVDMVAAFFNLIHSKSHVHESDDVLKWSLKKNGTLDNGFFYHAIRDSVSSGFPWKGIWGVKVPRRVTFFVWTAAWGNILTCDNLCRQVLSWLVGVVYVDVMKRLWRIFCYIVRWLGSFGVMFF
jgi:hypothetical protein